MELKQIKSAFIKCGIRKGDTLLLHGDAGVAAQFKIKKKNKTNYLFDQITKYLGKKSNILIPAFTYSSCKKKYYDKKNSPSENGLFSETFRKRKSVKRTNHPIFSFAIYGKKFSYFNNAKLETCFGQDSIFDRFYKIKGKIACLGCDLDRITFTHYVEQLYRVDYRYQKKFNIFNKDKKKFIKTEYFVRKLLNKNKIDLRALPLYLKKKKRIKEANFGRYKLLSVNSIDFFKSCIEMLDKNKNALIRGN